MIHSRLKFAIGLLPLLLFSCKKYKDTCSYSIVYANESVAFVGYSANELRQVIITTATAGSNFTQEVSTDTLDASGAFFRSDTAYASFDQHYLEGFFKLNPGTDYKVAFASTNEQYLITEVTGGPSSKTWTQDRPCSPGAFQARISTFSLKINGVQYTPFAPTTNNFFVYLGR